MGTPEHDADPLASIGLPLALERLATLQRSGSRAHSAALGGWVVTRHAEVRAVLIDRRATADRTRSYLQSLNRDMGPAATRLAAVRREMLLLSDGAKHRAHRVDLSPNLLGPGHRALERISGELAEALPAHQPFDFVERFARPFALAALSKTLGVHLSQAPILERLTAALHRAFRPDVTEDAIQNAADALEEIAHWMDDTDCFEGLVRVLRDRVRRRAISRETAVAHLASVVSAGHGTVRDALVNIVARLAIDPAARDTVVRQRRAEDIVVQELLRLEGPVLLTRREVREPLPLGDHVLKPGDRLVLALGTANRDPTVFEDPNRFNPERPELSRAIHFGFGAHRCIAAALGVEEITAGMRAFTGRWPAFDLGGPAEWADGTTMRARARLIIRLP